MVLTIANPLRKPMTSRIYYQHHLENMAKVMLALA